MARRLILDTAVCIASERGIDAIGNHVEPEDDVAIAAITVAEFRHGIELAPEHQRAHRLEFLVTLLESVPVEPYDLVTAEAHGKLLAHVHRSGWRPGAHDLIIAATAVATRRAIVTTDRRARFDQLPGVRAYLI